MQARINVFIAWFLIPHVLVMGWVAGIGRLLLMLLGVPTREDDVPGLLVGSVLVLAAVAAIRIWRGSLPPEGKPEGAGYRFGLVALLAGNALGFILLGFKVFEASIDTHNALVVLEKVANASGYMAMACWLAGFSFIYQSAQLQPAESANQVGSANQTNASGE